MKALAEFKKELGVEQITFLKNEKSGTQHVEINGKLLIMRKDVDKTKPLFVGMITKDKDGNPVPEGKAYAIFNSNAVTGDTI